MSLCFTTPLPLSARAPAARATAARPYPAVAPCATRAPRRVRHVPRCGADAPRPPRRPDDDSEGGAGAGADEHDIPQSAVDWNTEWTKFSAGGMRSMAPRGREPRSKEEIVAARAMGKLRDVAGRVPSRQELFRDWRFWLAIILTLSLFSAFVQSTQNAAVPYATI